MFFPKYLLMHPFNWLYFCTLSSRSISNFMFTIFNFRFTSKISLQRPT
jgi:hypothetical protein